MQAIKAISRPVAASVRGVGARGFAGLGSFPYTEEDPEYMTFPRERPGLDYSLNWSLADDAITPRGDAFRNAEVNQIIMASAGKVDGNKGLLGALNTKPLKVFATDEIPNAETMDVEEFEVLSEQARERFSHKQTLFVHDGAVGSHRSSEMRFRLITDSPEYALLFKQMANRVPLGDVETFPRPLVIYALSSESVGESCIVSDINPETQKATLLINGAADYHQVLDQVAAIASLAGMTPGYRSQRGGGPRVQQARSEGILHHYNEDRHQVASTEQEQDQAVITFRASTLVHNGASNLLVGDASGVAPNDVYAYRHTSWSNVGLTRTWGGVFAAGGSTNRGDLVTPTGSFTATTAAQAVAAPKRIALIGGKKGGKGSASATLADAITAIKAESGLTDEQAERLESKLKASKAQFVKASSAKAALA